MVNQRPSLRPVVVRPLSQGNATGSCAVPVAGDACRRRRLGAWHLQRRIAKNIYSQDCDCTVRGRRRERERAPTNQTYVAPTTHLHANPFESHLKNDPADNRQQERRKVSFPSEVSRHCWALLPDWPAAHTYTHLLPLCCKACCCYFYCRRRGG